MKMKIIIRLLSTTIYFVLKTRPKSFSTRYTYLLAEEEMAVFTTDHSPQSALHVCTLVL